ncbi:MAG: MGMT family protein [Chitinophagales bacterium]|nr:MGMT family protein [Chitinophagales bacterium]
MAKRLSTFGFHSTPDAMKKESFFDKVYVVARKIPRGRVTSYGAIADYLGTGLSARMVGWAMNSCHLAYPPVPAHRVVNRNGLLTGKHHFATPGLMEELLEAEGVLVAEDKVKDFRKLFWNPAVELKKRNIAKKSAVKSK